MIIMPIISLAVTAFSFGSMFAHIENETYPSLIDIGYFGDISRLHIDNIYRVNLEWLFTDALTEVIGAFVRTCITVFGIVQMYNVIGNTSTGSNIEFEIAILTTMLVGLILAIPA